VLLNTIGNDLKKQKPNLFAAIITKPVKKAQLLNALTSALLQTQSTVKKQAGILNKKFAEKHPLNILVVEDNPVNQLLILKVLNKLGYHPALAGNGKEAIELICDREFDVVLMDVEMPEMNGLEAARNIRASHIRQPIIVAMTASAMLESREECLAAGMDNYITKPIKLETLISMLKEV